MKPALSLLAFVPAAAYLALCLIFGGASRPTPWPPAWFGYTGLVLVLILAFPCFALRRSSEAISGPFLVLLLFAALAVLQLIPLPAELWSALPVRDRLLQGFDLLGAPPPDRLPPTLSPEATFEGLLRMFPAMAMLLLLVPVPRRSGILRLVWFIVIAGTAASVAGLLQLAAPELALPDIHQLGPPHTASGLFANQNHQATFLLVCMPMAAALASFHSNARQEGDANAGRRLVLLAAILLLAAGVWATGSRAGLALLLPVMILCFPVWRGRRGPHAGRAGLLIVLSTVVIGAAALLNSSRLPVPALADMTLSQDGRERIWQQSVDILRDNWITGTGSGTFSSAYALYEDPNFVTGVYVNHAHNEYLQIAVEMGLAGCLLMAVTLLVWSIASIRIWTQPDDGCRSLRRAASVSVLVILLHSLVDYPARTPALLVLGAALVFIQFFRPETAPAANLPPETRKKARGVVL